ncbi:MFS transporter [Chromobacterium violaceum]|uniref:Probable MFS metabolite transporter n=1 Tax=Chromobacterium violaceum (strain ATCC 12472 / DSM 30191 / JCM 1249 / CCUG 213 / NBRC 12614 / NCIMB 9131 / NCTC 9757 / MK) TaxID=243365 RepID=Q7NUB4_CHRVO|nr:MFS transporter [Chromobacterium violaceum]AAQ60454.1 probable MFS metabolite transporter [Chromobacterium violaceum ATCC 12472]OQS24077.1 MFS transporter [Chromobacterium violaceum]SUX35977.1 Probable 3-phenylpropionic acid transporter [Chromobacterium violaceum]
MQSLLPFASFYFTYFTFQGMFSPFWGLYLQSLSFSAWQISVLMALSTLARIVAPGFWGWLADRSGRRRNIIVTTSILSAASFCLVGLHNGFWWIFVSLAVSHFFWAAALPLVEASTAYLTRDNPGRYSRVRVWGSIGFVCLAMTGGYLLDWLGIAATPWIVSALLAGVALAAFKVPEVVPQGKPKPAGPIWDTLKKPAVMALFACCFLQAFAHGPYYTFYSLGLKAFGYDKAAVGVLWALGVVFEVGVFMLMPRIMRRFGLEALMLASLLAAVLRFGLIAACLASPAVAAFAQALHALTYALHHASAIGLINRMFAEQHHGRAQGLYIVASFGVGGSGGGLIGGLVWPHGGVLPTFAMSAAAALIGVLVCLRWLKPAGRLRAASPA